jgi:hypothetical protein
MDILEIISDDIELTKKGKDWWGLCPWHGEKTPSFSVSPAKGFFYCFGCGKSGDAINWLMRYRNMSYPQAAKYVGKPVEERTEWVSPKDRLMAAHRALREEWKTFGVEWALCRAKMTQGLGMSEEFRIATLNQLYVLLDRERDLQQRQDTIDRAYNMLG